MFQLTICDKTDRTSSFLLIGDIGSRKIVEKSILNEKNITVTTSEDCTTIEFVESDDRSLCFQKRLSDLRFVEGERRRDIDNIGSEIKLAEQKVITSCGTEGVEELGYLLGIKGTHERKIKSIISEYQSFSSRRVLRKFSIQDGESLLYIRWIVTYRNMSTIPRVVVKTQKVEHTHHFSICSWETFEMKKHMNVGKLVQFIDAAKGGYRPGVIISTDSTSRRCQIRSGDWCGVVDISNVRFPKKNPEGEVVEYLEITKSKRLE